MTGEGVQSRRAADAVRAHYGLDAPGAVRNLFIVATVGAMLLVARGLGMWDDRWRLAGVFRAVISLGGGCLIGGLGMIYFSKVAKLRMRDRLLDLVDLKGHERVLDVGCGRGLLLIGAAKRLTTGEAVGIDVWSAQDLSGNAAHATYANARAEGVRARVSVIDADARALPFADGSFDVVLSSTVLHNIYEAAGRERAVREIARVLRPGGRVFITDIRHVRQYGEVFGRAGVVATVGRLSVAGLAFPILSLGSVRPALLTGRKVEPGALASGAVVE